MSEAEAPAGPRAARRQRGMLLAALGLAAVSAVIVVLQSLGTEIPAPLALSFRWTGLAMLCAWAVGQRSLTAWILFAMLLGAEVGHDAPAIAVKAQFLGQIFLRLIKCIIAPLIFSTLVVGIAGHPDLRSVGRLGLKALVYFEIVTTCALFIGLAAINLTQAGTGLVIPASQAHEKIEVVQQTWQEIVLHVFPENFAKSVAEGQVLQVVVFAILFACALGMVGEEKRRPMLAFCESLSETMFRFTRLVMYLAPLGVGAAMAYTVGQLGVGSLKSLFLLLATLYLALIAFVALVLLPVALLARIPLGAFARAVAEPVSIAFATTSSEAALPRAMEQMTAFGVPRQIVAFVMPTGYSFNLDGSTLYLSLAAVFVAQAANVPMSFGEQLLMLLTLMLTSKGVAGVPRAALVILLGTLASFHLPPEPVFLILGIDALMDMGRTALNVLGNCLATVVVARWEGQLQLPSAASSDANSA